MTKAEKIMAIDPGTRYQGIAVFWGNRIIASMVKILEDKGPCGKRLKEVDKLFVSLIEDHAPDVLVIEKPLPCWTSQSRFLEAIIEEIKLLARKERIRVREFSPMAVRKIVCNNVDANKKDVAETVASIHTELKTKLNQNNILKEKYWGHVFDAAGLGLAYLKTKRK
jgi:Holliday junction resolvasome RuvABC endonuclease subunit